jgi:hypothetical protein
VVEGSIEIGGELVPIMPENAPRIRTAVATMRFRTEAGPSRG